MFWEGFFSPSFRLFVGPASVLSLKLHSHTVGQVFPLRPRVCFSLSFSLQINRSSGAGRL